MAAWSYFKTKEVVPSHLFIGPCALAQLKKELYTNTYSHQVKEINGNGVYIPQVGFSYVPSLKIVLVLEDRKDFIMVCQEQEYLDYVMERTVL